MILRVVQKCQLSRAREGRAGMLRCMVPPRCRALQASTRVLHAHTSCLARGPSESRERAACPQAQQSRKMWTGRKDSSAVVTSCDTMLPWGLEMSSAPGREAPPPALPLGPDEDADGARGCWLVTHTGTFWLPWSPRGH